MDEGGVGEECSVDGGGDSASKGSNGFILGVAVGGSPLQEAACWRVVAGLGERDSVDGDVELAVAGSAEAVPVGLGGPHRKRGGAVVAGVSVPGAEPANADGLAADLGGCERAHAVH